MVSRLRLPTLRSFATEAQEDRQNSDRAGFWTEHEYLTGGLS